jgi:hypothetical protein
MALCRDVDATSMVPIIFLTAMTDAGDRISGEDEALKSAMTHTLDEMRHGRPIETADLPGRDGSLGTGRPARPWQLFEGSITCRNANQS